jgi:carbonic anhydrase
VVAAVEVVENNATFPGRIGDMVEPIIPAVLSVRDEPGDLVANAVRANVRRVASGLPQASNLLAGLVEEGKLRIVGAHYDLEDGVVEFFDA